MKIAFICDYYLPFEVSGAEVSSRILAEELAKSGQKIVIVTPKYGNSSEREIQNKVSINRFSFLTRREIRSLPPYLVNNPVWYFYAAIKIVWILKKEKVDILHVQNKNLFIPAILANLLLHKSILATARDYRYLCDLGTCLLRENPKICSPKEYLLSDLPKYIKLYKKTTISVFVMSYIIGIYNLLLRKVYKVLLQKINKVICVSSSVEKIYNQAGIRNTTTIYNLINFKDFASKRKKQILFVGRYTPGKGKELLNLIIPQFLEKHKSWQCILITRDKVEISHDRLSLIDYLPHDKILQLISEVSLILVPSLWPEPLSRASLDALSVGTPVISSKRGGMTEIISDGINGYTFDYTKTDFLKKINLGIQNLTLLKKNITAHKKDFQKKFHYDPINKYLSLIKKL